MPELLRIRTDLVGTAVVGGGVNDLYFQFTDPASQQNVLDTVRAFWDGWSDSSTNWTASWNGAQAVIDSATGDIVRFANLTPPTPVSATLAGDMLPPSNQLLVKFRTNGVVANRRVQGKMFLPGCTEVSSTNGNPDGGMVNGVTALAQSLIGDVDNAAFVIWSRPFDPPAGSTRPGRAGSAHNVISAECWAKFAVLRSRRD